MKTHCSSPVSCLATFILGLNIGWEANLYADAPGPVGSLTVQMTSPISGATFDAPANLSLAAKVESSAGPVIQVEFFEGPNSLGTDTTAPFEVNWNNVPPGIYTITAKATDNLGTTVHSRAITIAVIGAVVAGVQPTILCVDRNNTTGMVDGSPTTPYATIQSAIDAAMSGDIIKVASGQYHEHVTIAEKVLALKGGYAGGAVEDYRNGNGGDFTTRTPKTTHVQGDKTTAVVHLCNSQNTVVEGFHLSGGERGVHAEGFPRSLTFPTIANNLIAQNGTADENFPGGGVYSDFSNMTIINNVITDNQAGRGSAIAAFGPGDSDELTVFIKGNTITDNVGYQSHGAAVWTAAKGIVTQNLISNNVGTVWGGGVLALGKAAVVTLSRNVITRNFAILGSGVFFDEGAQVVLENELIFRNRAPADGGGAVYVDGGDATRATLVNCTIADNEGYRASGNGLYLQNMVTVDVKNSIFWNNGGREFFVEPGSMLTVSYSDCDERVAGPGNLRIDPLFASAAMDDYHLKSTAGRWDPLAQGAQGGQGAFVIDAVDSPCIDAGDPTSEFAGEPAPNGGHVNLGAYGNTPEASRTSLSFGVSTQLPDRTFELRLRGPVGQRYKIEASPDLAIPNNWVELVSLLKTGGTIIFLDTDAPNFPQRFYRAQQVQP